MLDLMGQILFLTDSLSWSDTQCHDRHPFLLSVTETRVFPQPLLCTLFTQPKNTTRVSTPWAVIMATALLITNRVLYCIGREKEKDLFS